MDNTIKIKTIDVNAKECFDKVNGNSYFSALITINYGIEDEQILEIPFRYGYGDYYLDVAMKFLSEKELINNKKHENGSWGALWCYCADNNIILRTSKKDNCKKREL